MVSCPGTDRLPADILIQPIIAGTNEIPSYSGRHSRRRRDAWASAVIHIHSPNASCVEILTC